MIINSSFRPAWWLRNPHLQTLWASKVQPAPCPATTRERLTTPDNDFLDLDWNNCRHTGADQPLIVAFHGLTGSSNSRYIRHLLQVTSEAGIACVLMHFRGCSGEPNRTRGSYHSGHTADIKFVIDTLAKRFATRPVAAVGYSLGGNALLKYLATEPDIPLHYAVSVSPPLVLAEGAKRMSKGFSRLYQWNLIKQMKRALRDKDQRYPAMNLSELNYQAVDDFWSFDNNITAVLHGFDSVTDYYTKASTLNDLPAISTPTHIIFARDDPFFSEKCLPQDNHSMSAAVTFEIAGHGGHVGFIGPGKLFRGDNWLPRRVTSLIRTNV